jgi:hypothetical protein
MANQTALENHRAEGLARLQAEYEEMPTSEKLERAFNLARNTRTDTVDEFTPEEWIKIHRAYARGEWDLTPDEWTDRQLREAIEGHSPRFEDEGGNPGRAIYADGTKQCGRRNVLCDGCGVEISEDDFCTDSEVCDGSDAPGFFVCNTCATSELQSKSVAERSAHYTAQRELNKSRM